MTPFELAILHALQREPVYKEDVGDPRKAPQLEAFAEAIAKASAYKGWKGPRKQLAALLVTVALHETNLSLRIQLGGCKAYECDHGRAAGPWQIHESERVKHDEWLGLTGEGVQPLLLGATVAARILTGNRAACGGEAPGILSAYAGQRCDSQWKGLSARLNTFNRVLARL